MLARLQISLRRVVVALLLGATACGTVLFLFRDRLEERRAVLSLRGLGYEVALSSPHFDEPEPGFGMVRFLGILGERRFDGDAMALVTRFRGLRILALCCDSIEPGALHRLGERLSLQFLGISGAHVDDRGLQGIRTAAGLERLTIRDTGIQGEALVEISSMREIKEIRLEGNSALRDFHSVNLRHLNRVVLIDLSRTGIAGDCLGWLPNCRELHLDESPAGDESLRGLWRCTRLERLDLQGTRVTGKGLRHLASLPLLTYLNLSDCPISDESLDYIQGLKNLKTLCLVQTPISDTGLDRLGNAKQLKYVGLSGCPHISAAGIARLRRSLVIASAKDSDEPEGEVEADDEWEPDAKTSGIPATPYIIPESSVWCPQKSPGVRAGRQNNGCLTHRERRHIIAERLEGAFVGHAKGHAGHEHRYQAAC